MKGKTATEAVQQITNIHNLIILDESGSMRRIYNQALDGANETIHTVKGAQAKFPDQKHFLSFVTFDEGSNPERVRFIIDGQPITDVRDLTSNDYNPDGCTPLYDAIGVSLNHLQKQVKGDDQVLVTIITDGMENASKEYNGASVKNMIDSLKKKGWTFVFMGANMDSGRVAKGLSIDNSMDFDATAEGSQTMFSRVNHSRMSYYSKVSGAKAMGIEHFCDNDFWNDNDDNTRTTPDIVTSLGGNEVFVFGSNILGNHNGGAAGQAAALFGAIQGQACGPQGRCYAIATDGATLEAIKAQEDQFIEYAATHRHHRFLVTRIGCGNAGYSPEQIAPLFIKAKDVKNICLPAEFWAVLNV